MVLLRDIDVPGQNRQFIGLAGRFSVAVLKQGGDVMGLPLRLPQEAVYALAVLRLMRLAQTVLVALWALQVLISIHFGS